MVVEEMVLPRGRSLPMPENDPPYLYITEDRKNSAWWELNIFQTDGTGGDRPETKVSEYDSLMSWKLLKTWMKLRRHS
jgi:hypothetical protein